jgi:hypothetical protein
MNDTYLSCRAEVEYLKMKCLEAMDKYKLTMDDLVQYARDYCFDNHDGFVSNNYSWTEMWLSKHGIDEEKEK